MIIEAIDLYLVRNPLIRPWTTAYGSDPFTYSVLTRFSSGEHVGWSEASPLFAPTYSPEYAHGVFHLIQNFIAPKIIGRSFASAEEITSAMSFVKGNPFAKSACEIAWWTLFSSIRQVPLHQLFGGTFRNISAGADFGVQNSIDDLLELIQGVVEQGIPRVKLKAMRGWDIDMLKAVRSTFPQQVFHIDCNASYHLTDLAMFKEIDKLGLAMIEQPLGAQDILDHAKLQNQLETPICLDESLSSPEIAGQAIELGACRYMNLKPGRLGGIGNSLQVNAMCQKAGIGCWVGSMLETALGSSICIELASIDNITYPNDIFASDYFYHRDLTTEPIVFAEPGTIYPSRVAGNPKLPDWQILAERTVCSDHFEI